MRGERWGRKSAGNDQRETGVGGKKERGKEERFYSQGLDRALKNEPTHTHTHTHNLHVLGDIKK